ncbi:unnamed protein product [Symbiodinium natans]|uniref:Response regulatory domain-containing protein n=1 Tax=Symbiodinium natans TaxID=878477 RepID=A0A812UG35_9DINO|nr:unnamed protein product [Symbiodinium natans]
MATELSSIAASFASFKGQRLERRVAVLSVEQELCLATCWVLELLGSRAKGFDDAEALVEEATFDLVLCDLDLASALLEKLATPSGRLSLSVVLVCPKRMDKRLLASCLDRGARGYVAKPLRVQAIRGVLLRYATPEEDAATSPAGGGAGHYERAGPWHVLGGRCVSNIGVCLIRMCILALMVGVLGR